MRVKDVRRTTSAPPRANRRRAAGFGFNWWHGVFFLLGLAAALLARAYIPALGLPPPRLPGPAPQPAPSGPQPAWGQLEYTSITLERPDESFPPVPPTPKPIQWTFDHCTETQLDAEIARFDLTPRQKQILADRTCWQRAGPALRVTPAIELVREMSPAARKAIYARLASAPDNFFIQNPFRLPADRFDRWLADTGLPDDKQSLIRRVTLIEDKTALFYDSQLLELLCSGEERKLLARAVAQIPALLMSLRVTPYSDVDALAKYWGRGGRGHIMKPFLESLRHVPNGVSVSVSFFFPTFARMRLYTYPDLQRHPFTGREDCFWTAMNFFNDAPDDRFSDGQEIKQTLKTEFTQVSTNWSFGDVIMLVDAGEAVHMCVYVADGVVFTKNGADYLEPWVLMKMPDMLARYTHGRTIEVLGFRRKRANT